MRVLDGAESMLIVVICTPSRGWMQTQTVIYLEDGSVGFEQQQQQHTIGSQNCERHHAIRPLQSVGHSLADCTGSSAHLARSSGTPPF